MSLFAAGARVHVVGVGGAGMSGLALLLHEAGARVSGSDVADSPVLAELRTRGVDARVGHDPARLEGVGYVLWSPAVAEDDPERLAARAFGVVEVPRASALAELARVRPVLGVTGTHGKTTATSMLVQVSLAAGRDDAWLVGAPVVGVGANGHWGRDAAIVEVDESYGTFAELEPEALGLLNVEADHLDHYQSLENVEAAFAALVARTRGPVAYWIDDEGARRAVERAGRDAVSVGRVAGTWRVGGVDLARRASRFTLTGPGGRLALSLRVTGAHNVANAAVAAALASSIGVAPDAIERGLANFVGAPRRDQFRGAWRGVDVYETYAHLPSELAASVAALRAAKYERLTVVFQPHRVTRTLVQAPHFPPAFAGVSEVVVTDLYLAGEANPGGVTGEVVVDALRAYDAAQHVTYVARLEDVSDALVARIEGSDALLVAGAGDVGTLIDRLPGGLS